MKERRGKEPVIKAAPQVQEPEIPKVHEKVGARELPIGSRTDRAAEGMTEARGFFESMEMPIGSDGLISRELTKDQIERLSEWRKRTFTGVGVDMEGEQEFYRKVYLAVSLWRQMKNGGVNYLIGRGVAVEAALISEVEGREKRDVSFPYRTHSDFDFYGCTCESGPNGENIGGTPPYPDAFIAVFGHQEYFPGSSTKGLNNIPDGFLNKTAEKVNLGGVEILIPELEILFVDKVLNPEGGWQKRRPEGPDAELLAMAYRLDRAKVHRYLDEFRVMPDYTKSVAAYDIQGYGKGVKQLFELAKKSLNAEKIGLTPELITARMNDIMTQATERTRREDLVVMPSRSGDFRRQLARYWTPLNPKQIDSEGNIKDPDFTPKLEERVRMAHMREFEESQRRMHERVNEVLDRAEGRIKAKAR